MADETAADCLQTNLLQLAPKIIKIAEKKNLASEEAKNLLGFCKPEEMDDDLSAERKPKAESFLYQFGDAKGIAMAAKPGMAPFLVIGGTSSNPEYHETSVVAENKIIFKACGLLDAILHDAALLRVQLTISKAVFQYIPVYAEKHHEGV